LLFEEKIDLLLKVRDNEHVYWSEKFRPSLNGQGVYPRPLQKLLPIWLGVGGTPQSFERADMLGLPLMVAIIGGQARSFRPFIDLYREAWRQDNGHPQHNQLKVGIHSLGYVAESTKEAVEDFFPGYARSMNKIGKEHGWHKITRTVFDAQRGPEGALLVGDPEEIVEKIIRHSKSLGGISRITFMMNASSLPHEKLMQAIKLIGTRVAPTLQ
jgi:alkanesulfonate monooxygenase SsuD/methylene tetrahydromethanopterin reductase-like flavin-dependent oxidoreductase (luciferase family)